MIRALIDFAADLAQLIAVGIIVVSIAVIAIGFAPVPVPV